MTGNRITLTGGINSGKTTIIEELRKRGFDIVEESAVATIRALQHELGSVKAQTRWIQNDFQTGEPSEFHTRNIKRQINSESGIDLDKLTFLDRGILDYEAFCNLRNLPISPWMKQVFDTRAKYNKVFICDSLPIFDSREGTGRIIDEELARKMTKLCRDSYKRAGYELTEVPIFGPDSSTLLTPSQRADFILQQTL